MERENLLALARRTDPAVADWDTVPTTTPDAWRRKLMEGRRPGGVIYRTSGTTGSSTELAFTSTVVDGAARRAVEAFRRTPIQAGDAVAVCFGYGCFPPSDFYQRALIELGCDVLPMGSGRNLGTEAKCAWLAIRPVQGLVGMPSYLRQLARALTRRELWNELRRHLRFVVVGGEPLFAALRTELEAAYKVPVFDHYGMLEAPMIAGGCHARMHVSPEYVAEVAVAGGVVQGWGRGGLVLSSRFTWPGIPMMRLLTGDEVTLDPSTCECGDGGPVVVVHGRSDNVRKLRGARVSLPALHECLMSILVHEYCLEVSDSRSGERVVLRVDTAGPIDVVRAHAAAVMPFEFEVRLEPDLTPPSGPTGKVLHFDDRRGGAQGPQSDGTDYVI